MIFTITFLIIGLLLIVAGYKFSKEPGRRNYYYGFRNSLTMNSHHAWREVNIYGGKQTLKWGILFFVLSPLGFIISNELSIIIGILFPVTFAYGLNSSVSKYMNTLFDSDGNRLLDKSLEINKELDQNI